MLTIYVLLIDVPMITVDGLNMTVKMMLVHNENELILLRDFNPPSNLEDVEIFLVRRFTHRKFRLSSDVKRAILTFLQHYHAKQNIEFDCYSFANLTKGVEGHKVPFMSKYWDTKSIPWRVPIGSVIFFLSDKERFHHAAIYIGFELYISVWGAGGDLEVATLSSMKREYGAKEVVLAQPKTN